ncbi:MAG: hypothetical protein VX246_12675 [Myxococcota bacterium]|nr:hypothetical protein [Myxococcota bacterium]
MTHSGDGDRPKLSYSERDKLRREGPGPGGDKRPRGRWAEAQERRASDGYKKHLETMFSSDQGGQRGEELAGKMRAAHGGEGFLDACRAYCDEVGFPADTELICMVLDTAEPELVIGMLEVVLEGVQAGVLDLSKGLRRQVTTLAEDFNSGIADVAEEILDGP